jgi:hypothetical protein
VKNALQRKPPEDRDFSLAFPSFCIASRPNLAVPESTVATRDAMQKPRHFPMSGTPHPTPTPPVDDRLHGPEGIRIGRTSGSSVSSGAVTSNINGSGIIRTQTCVPIADAAS